MTSHTNDRGGICLKEGRIGRVNCLRQQLLSPGEVINSRIKGSVKLESLRERDSLRIHAHLATFLTPVRWLEPEWPDFVKQGPHDTAAQIQYSGSQNLSIWGLGGYTGTQLMIPTFFMNSYRRIYNEWYKYPEDDDVTGVINELGEPAVPLQAAWSRARYTGQPDDTEDYLVPSGSSFDVRDLAKVQGQFKAGIERDVLSYNRYMELLEMMYGADGSREVDQVPIMVDQTEVGVQPREHAATDGASLGQWQSIFDFNVDHHIRGISFPEHAVLTYMLVIRFSAISEVRSPFASDQLSWEAMVLDKDILEQSRPSTVTVERLFADDSQALIGYLPAGWEWRTGFDVIGRRVDIRDTFPYMRMPTNQTEAKDATRINPAFKSQALGDYLVDLYFTENSRSKVNTALESWYSGLDGGWDNSEFPNQGKML